MSFGNLQKNLSRRAERRDGPCGFRFYAIVYAIHAPDAKRIKIGRTLDINKRLSSLRGASPIALNLLGHVWLPDDAEAALHDYLKDDHSHYEWFHATERVRGISAWIAAGMTAEIVSEIGLGVLLVDQIPSKRIAEIDDARFTALSWR